MRIREVNVTDYRAFEGTHMFPMADSVTVVAGVNGRGKTALLDGLALLLSRLLRSLRLTAGDTRTITAADVHGQRTITSLTMKVNCAGIPLEYGVSYTPSKRRVVATRLSSAVRDQLVSAYGDPTRADDQAPLAVYYTTDRAGYRLPKTLPRTLPVGQQLAYAGALVNRMVDYRDFMARFRVWQQEGPRELRAFYNALRTFLDGFDDVEIAESPPRITLKKRAHRLRLDQLSDGERSFVALIADLVRRLALANPALVNPLKGAGVVLIDELELHLHPQWQRTIVEKLRTTFPNLQFVATTHSPFIIQSLRAGELISLDPDVFREEYSNKSIEDIAEVVQGIKLPQKSERYRQMVDAAEEFIRKARGARTTDQVENAKRELDALAEAYSDDPAYVALLRVERSSMEARVSDATH